MYNYIKGTITEVTSNYVTLECYGVGYYIHVPNPYTYAEGEQLTVHVHHLVREEIDALYGFKTIEERNVFVKLINVKGLGPKGAMAILASSTPIDIANAIDAGNSKFFSSFPGIGPKSSQQIILDLKGKLVFEDNTTISKTSENLQNVSSALKALGYNTTEIKGAIKDLPVTEDTPTAEAVKMALRRLQKN